MQSHFYINRLEEQLQGVNIPFINKGKLLETPISIPASVAEMEVIVEKVNSKLDSIGRMENEIEGQLRKAAQNKQSILATAFSGDLVEPMVGDSSAKDLLAKIAEEAKKNSEKPKIKIVKKKVNKRMTKRSLVSVLEENEKGLSPEKLMQESGFIVDEVDEFYQELSALFDRLEEMGLKDVDKNNWPYDAVVNLKLKDR